MRNAFRDYDDAQERYDKNGKSKNSDGNDENFTEEFSVDDEEEGE